MPVPGLFGDGLGDGLGDGQLSHPPDPQIDDNTPARGGIIIYNNGVWRVAKLTILPTVTPTPLGRLPGGLPGQPTQIINSIKRRVY